MWRAILKTRRHHNTKGLRQIKNGSTVRQVEAMARRLRKADMTNVSREPLKNDYKAIYGDCGR